MKNKIKNTWIMNKSLVVFVFRLTVFLSVFGLYLRDKALLGELMNQPIVKGITPIHVLWLVFVVMMLRHIFPTERISMGARKADEKRFAIQENYSELELLQFVKEMNIRAWKVMLVWLFGNGVVGFFYLIGFLDNTDLFMLTVFFFLSDYICILFYCPFQSKIMKNRCCVNCRIFDWGHFMMFTPMLFIRNFFSWSLFFLSCVVLIRWEIIYSKYPERFWFGSNQNLRCKNCKDRLCRYKHQAHKPNFTEIDTQKE